MFVVALGGSGETPLPPSEVLAMVSLENTGSTGEIM